jgi:hypothetical protein
MRSQLLKCSAFDADQLKKLDEAFEEVCSELHLLNRKEAFVNLVANKVMECARSGEQDPQCISEIVALELRRSAGQFHH